MKQVANILGVAVLLGIYWAGIVLAVMRPLIGVPVLAAAIAATVLAARHSDRHNRLVAPAPAPIEWRVFDEELPADLSETELAMRARHGGPDDVFWHNAKVYTDLPWQGTPGPPRQRDGGLN